MEAPPSNSELSLRRGSGQVTDATAASAAAWHVLGLLISHQRPVWLKELASSCTLFHCTPDCIQFLCSIPNSPLLLTGNQLVTLSGNGINIIAQFFADSDVNSMCLEQRTFALWSLENMWSDDKLKTRCRRRKRRRKEVEDFNESTWRSFQVFCEGNLNQMVPATPDSLQNLHAQHHFLYGDLRKSIEILSIISSIFTNDYQKLENFPASSLLMNSSSARSDHEIEKNECVRNVLDDNSSNWESIKLIQRSRYQLDSIIPIFLKPIVTEKIMNYISYPELSLSQCIMNCSKLSNACGTETVNSFHCSSDCSSLQEEADSQKIVLHAEGETVVTACKSLIEEVEENINKPPFRKSGRRGKEKENLLINADGFERERERENVVEDNDITACMGNSRTVVDMQCQVDMLKQPVKSASMLGIGKKNPPNKRGKSKSPALTPQIVRENKREKKIIPVRPKEKCTVEQKTSAKEKIEACIENKKRSLSNSINHDIEKRPFPSFKSFTIEEEEGSGGYGTIYRARRKVDGVAFAIKCPHDNANKNHVQNELKMLEKFGGKNFVIKYEGLLKNGNSECLVLEHVEHDRPEVLKKGINVFQLQWYGYCMFRALAALHKQGIVHRDVKPGNFLFSRKVNKGYLIDFNLALDVHKNFGHAANSKAKHEIYRDHIPPSQRKFIPPMKSRKFPYTRLPEMVNQDAGKHLKQLLSPGNLKRKIDQTVVFTKSNSQNNIKSQGADGSGITSAKDPASTKAPSAERLREPMPNQGRKELITLVQEALQVGSSESENAPTSKRKRIAAPPADVDCKYFYPTPMPLSASGVAISGSGLPNDKGDKRPKREGPCVGTKGFRAPEVLFRSLHQGPKVDVWSAGVTLLYLIIGRAPFVGDPDQNIKEVAKLRGSEDLWEVAKLHNPDSSFPKDLLDVKYLPSMKLEEWCVRNTRRPHFLKELPKSLLDLVDKCLTVNPRLRISAEEALKHEFFASCHEALRKHRLQKQVPSTDSKTTVLMPETIIQGT